MSLSDKEENQAWSDKEEYFETGANQDVHLEFELKKGKMKIVFDGCVWLDGAEDWNNLDVQQTVIVNSYKVRGEVKFKDITLYRPDNIEFFFEALKDDIEDLLNQGIYENDVELDGSSDD